MGRGTDSERPSSVADPASDTEAAMSNHLAEQRSISERFTDLSLLRASGFDDAADEIERLTFTLERIRQMGCLTDAKKGEDCDCAVCLARIALSA